ncbi:MAG: hypothetical protein IPP44_00165 [Ideonella sp.]|nr:hypothetical protein [Ideonella sp.]
MDITSNDNPFPLVVIDTDGNLTLRAARWRDPGVRLSHPRGPTRVA